MNGPEGWFKYGLPGSEERKLRSEITLAVRGYLDLNGIPLEGFEVEAGARCILLTLPEDLDSELAHKFKAFAVGRVPERYKVYAWKGNSPF